MVMSVEQKIRELMSNKSSTESKRLDEATLGADLVDKDQTIKAANEGDRATKPRQGSSADASFETLDVDDEEDENVGAALSKTTPNSPRPQGSGPGNAPNFKTVGDPTSVVNMPGSAGNVPMESVDIKTQLASILGDSITEEFQTKATALFEAAVIARVNSEVDKLTEALEENAIQQVTEAKEEMVSKVDSYLSYVVEQWMEENKLAVESGLRTEIAEDFITGLKTLFQEHYIDVPEEKYNVLDEMQSSVEELEEKLNESMNNNIVLTQEVIALKKARILEAQSQGLASTESEKLLKLVEGIDFDSDSLFEEKVSAIKETYFPKAPKTSSADMLTEDITGTGSFEDETAPMAKYVNAISKIAKSR